MTFSNAAACIELLHNLSSAPEAEKLSFPRIITETALLHYCYVGNPGHLVYDCLYAGFLAMLRFYPADHKILGIVFSQFFDYNYATDNDMVVRFCRDFWGAGLMTLDMLDPSRPILFREILLGVENLGILGAYDDFMLSHHGADSLRLFRNRMYTTHGLPLPQPQLPNQPNITALIIANKRYTAADWDQLRQMKAFFTANNTATRRMEGPRNKTKILIEFFLWDVKDMTMQIEIFSKVGIYITGPGTGMVFHFLLPDGAAVINLGAIMPGCHNESNPCPYFMEQYVAAAAWIYQSAHYYNSTIRYRGLQKSELIRLVVKASRAVGRVSEVVKSPRDNLSPEGQLIRDVCLQPEQPCARHFIVKRQQPKAVVNTALNISVDDLNQWHGCRTYRWSEFALYEMCPFHVDGAPIASIGVDPKYIPHGREPVIRCESLPRDLIRAKRKTEEFRYHLANVS